jgi:hypothetical protein
MSKQTAVNWLRNESIKLVVQVMQGTLNKDTLEHQISQIVTKAMAMEREQIEEAYGDGLNAHRVDFCNRNEYYQKTYGGQDA